MQGTKIFRIGKLFNISYVEKNNILTFQSKNAARITEFRAAFLQSECYFIKRGNSHFYVALRQPLIRGLQ
jgi:hypothetical protein